MSAQREGLQWLFALNLGGVAGVLTYASAKSANQALYCALAAFSSGLLLLIWFAIAYFYHEARQFALFKAAVLRFRADGATWADVVRTADAAPDRYRDCEVLALASGVLAIVGIVLSAVAVL